MKTKTAEMASLIWYEFSKHCDYAWFSYIHISAWNLAPFPLVEVLLRNPLRIFSSSVYPEYINDFAEKGLIDSPKNFRLNKFRGYVHHGTSDPVPLSKLSHIHIIYTYTRVVWIAHKFCFSIARSGL